MKLLSLLIPILLLILVPSCKKDDRGDDAPTPQEAPNDDGGEISESKKKDDDGSSDGNEVTGDGGDGAADDGGDDSLALDEEDPLSGLLPAENGALASAPVPASLSLVTFETDDSSGGRSFSLVAQTDRDRSYEYQSRWDPATAPLKSLNRVLKVVAKTGYAAFVDKGKRVSKMKLGSIFDGGKEDDVAVGTASGEGGQGGGGDTLVDVTFEALRTDDKKLHVKIWFTRTIDNTDWMFWHYSNGDRDLTEVNLNYYASLTIHKNSRIAPPYGIFDFFYEMRVEKNNEENTDPSLEGYVFVSDNEGEVQVKYRETNSSRYSYADCTGTWEGNECTEYGPTTTWEYSTTQLANALLTTEGGKKILSGKARTASQYGSQLIEGSDTRGYGSWSNDSGSYSMAYNPKDGLTPEASETKRGASLTKWVPGDDNHQYGTDGTGWFGDEENDPRNKRCEEIGNESIATYMYSIFDSQGKKVPHKTYLSLVKEGSTDWAGCWISRWGSSCYGDISSGDSLKSYDGDAYTVQLYAGTLMDTSDWTDVTSSTTSDLTLECEANCPKAGLTQSDLDSRWTSSPTAYLSGATTYTFDAATKTLTYEDGGTKTVGFDESSNIQWGWINVQLTHASGATYDYQMSTDNKPAIAFDADNVQFVPAEPIVFANEAFNPAIHARANSQYDETMTNLSDATWDMGPLQMESGYLQIGTFQSDVVDQWGGFRNLPKLTLKPGLQLTVDGDPDGVGPIQDGQKLTFEPLYSEVFPNKRSEEECSASLHAAIDDMNDANMPLPGELPDDGNNVKAKIGASPSGSFQVAAIEGEIVIEQEEDD